jgi:dienelactone hydrolase
VAVQTGEGTVDIIFHTASVPAGPRTLGGYISRPDALGQWPTVMVFGPVPKPTSAIKNICRVLSRHGIAAFAPDLTDSAKTNHSISKAVAAFLQNPSGVWSNAQMGYGVIAFGKGLADAAALAAADRMVDAWVAIGADLDDISVGNLADSDSEGLVILSRGDGSTDVDASVGRKDEIPKTTFVVYPTGDDGFWNDSAEGYDDARATDSLDRAISFFSTELPPRV